MNVSNPIDWPAPILEHWINIAVLGMALLGTAALNLFFIRIRRKQSKIAEHLTHLYYQRAKLAETALSGTPLQPMGIAQETYAFSGWVQLCADGTVKVSDQTFSLNAPFEITARDAQRIPRATAASDGSGHLVIHSHGMSYAVRFTAGAWDVQDLPNAQHQELA